MGFWTNIQPREPVDQYRIITKKRNKKKKGIESWNPPLNDADQTVQQKKKKGGKKKTKK